MASTSIAIPGQLLGPANKYKPGPGVHLHEANLYSSLLGTVSISQPPSSSTSTSSAGPAKRLTKITASLHAKSNKTSTADGLPTISVAREDVATANNNNSSSSNSNSKKQREVLPTVGNVVLCRVTRITPRQAVVAILVCGDTVLEAEWQGVIRVQDVRATEKDRVKIYESFRPGDIVRASVVSLFSSLSFFGMLLVRKDVLTKGWFLQISLGDQANYYLSTASNELGVIMAVSEAGNAMYPVSWKEYKDPETGVSESRKVAKPY